MVKGRHTCKTAWSKFGMLAIQHGQRTACLQYSMIRPETGSKIDVTTGGEQKRKKEVCAQCHTPFSSLSILISLSVGTLVAGPGFQS